ncbi:MAG: UDP-2,4-diacetamido-2,4,6-trideoxy-beta-L-altropyranose hydrolase [Xanthomarina sp.]
MTRKILFRADGNSDIGLGHLYRLFALVEMYKEHYDFVFLTKESSILTIIPNWYNVKTIPEGIDIKNEPLWISSNFLSQEYIIIADGYQFTSIYQQQIKQKGYSLIYIDDLAVEHMFADVVINHSPHITKSNYKCEKYTKFAHGLDYAVLRPAFLAETKKKREIKKIDSVFLCFGGADKDNFTLKIYNLLREIDSIKEIHIILGAGYNHQTNLKDDKTFIYRNLSENDLITVMYNCNLAITPTSTILLELCCINIPVISGYLEDNQKKAYTALNELGAISGIGNFRKFLLSESNLENIINNLEIQKLLDTQNKLLNRNQLDNFKKLIKTL